VIFLGLPFDIHGASDEYLLATARRHAIPQQAWPTARRRHACTAAACLTHNEGHEGTDFGFVLNMRWSR